MSAIVCGKRAYFDELPDYSSSSPIPVSKRIRYASSSSPVRLSLSKTRLFDRLLELFPSMDNQHLEKALDECGGDIDVAIKSLHQLCLGSSEGSAYVNHVDPQVEQGRVASEGEAVPSGVTFAQNTLPTDGTQWVELLVSEMMSAASVEDARVRAARVLEALEKSIKANSPNTSSEAVKEYGKENMMLKEKIQGLMCDNSVLKRAVQIQHNRQKEFDEKSQEVQQLKQLLAQYQEQMRALEAVSVVMKPVSVVLEVLQEFRVGKCGFRLGVGGILGDGLGGCCLVGRVGCVVAASSASALVLPYKEFENSHSEVRAQSSSSSDYYATLGVSMSAYVKEIKAAYRRLARQACGLVVQLLRHKLAEYLIKVSSQAKPGRESLQNIEIDQLIYQEYGEGGVKSAVGGSGGAYTVFYVAICPSVYPLHFLELIEFINVVVTFFSHKQTNPFETFFGPTIKYGCFLWC
ncbi:hypothetical protein KSS87_016337 [Heliosperma pusillum]|nr:hypothetical protein KSS87_016337 [Heliosperma pusillum]